MHLNHAGTSWPKPREVIEAAASVLSSSPETWGELFSTSHQTIAGFLHVPADRLLLTPSCTSALNLAITDLPWESGDRVLTSGYEHHAMQRNLVHLSRLGVRVETVAAAPHALLDLDMLRKKLQAGRVRLVAFTAACNVTGLLAPIAEATALAHEHGALALVDGAQIAGWWDVDPRELGADLFTIAAHKGPQAPWGVGGLYVAAGTTMVCPSASCEAGDGAAADGATAIMPGYCDAGSVNLAALAGWAAACHWLRDPARASRLPHARQLAADLTDGLREQARDVVIHHDVDPSCKMPTVAATFPQLKPAELSSRLAARGIQVSAGFQCAPAAHASLGTTADGVLRFSLGPQSTGDDVQRTLAAWGDVCRPA